MNNPFINSDNNKRYLTLSYYNRQIYGGRVYKASLNLGCLCPNINRITGKGGCTYCTGPSVATSSLTEQLNREQGRILSKCNQAKIIAYFQSGTNTYCEPSFLFDCCCKVLYCPNIVGISIGTRADCIDENMVDMLYYLSLETNLTVELGLQTVHDITAKRINRGHTFSQFLKGYELLRERNIRVCVHLINSLPNENRSMMVESAKTLGALNPNAVKIHMLNILQGTALAEQYETTPFPVMSRHDYVETVVTQLEYLPKDCVIERLTGDGIKNSIIEPEWAKDKLKTLVEIDKLQAKINSYQGKGLE